jgi:hypothetical protein
MTTPANLFEHAAKTAPATILIGLDDKDRRHASWFNASETPQATQAATIMGMATLPVSSPELAKLAGDLPHGKIFSGSGKAFVPFVKQSLFEKLAAHLPDRAVLAELRAVATSADVAAGAAKGKGYRLPKDWSGFKPNDLVLATEGGHQDGWYECVIVEATDQNALVLQWRDWPEEPKFERRASEVALMWSSSAPAPASN